MKHVALLAALLGSSACNATGFGWYACSVEWKELDRVIYAQKEKISARSDARTRPGLRDELQGEVDDAIVALCDEAGTDESPASAEFYDIDSMAYALEYQRERGIKDSYFERFEDPPRAVQIGPHSYQGMIYPVHFTLPPDDVEKFAAELRELNGKPHPPHHHRQFRHLEAVMMKVMNDLWRDPVSGPDAGAGRVFESGERALIFFGMN